MFVLGNILAGLASLLNVILEVYFWVLVGRAIVSWVQANPYNAIVRFLYAATEPPLRAIRQLLPRQLRYFPLDIAFLVLIGLVHFTRIAVVGTLIDLSIRLR